MTVTSRTTQSQSAIQSGELDLRPFTTPRQASVVDLHRGKLAIALVHVLDRPPSVSVIPRTVVAISIASVPGRRLSTAPPMVRRDSGLARLPAKASITSTSERPLVADEKEGLMRGKSQDSPALETFSSAATRTTRAAAGARRDTVARAARRGASTTRADNMDALDEAGDEPVADVVPIGARGLQTAIVDTLHIVTLILAGCVCGEAAEWICIVNARTKARPATRAALAWRSSHV
jgi:hypothetical protein